MKAVRVPMESLIEVILLQLKTANKANLTVTGYSMLPMLRQFQDAVQLKPIDGMLRPGDISLYRRNNGQYVLHRVIRLTPQGYLFCGDNQAELETVHHDQLIAVVDSYTKNGKALALSGIGYRLYCFVWVKLFFMRKSYIRLRRWLGRLWRQLFYRR